MGIEVAGKKIFKLHGTLVRATTTIKNLFAIYIYLSNSYVIFRFKKNLVHRENQNNFILFNYKFLLDDLSLLQ